MKFTKLIAIALCISALLSLLSCTHDRNSNDKKYIAVIVKSLDSDFWHNVKNGVESAATEYNVNITFEGPQNEEDFETQNRLISNAVDGGADAIVLSAINYYSSADAVNAAVRRGTKVIIIDSDINSNMPSMFIGTDNLAAGKKAGKIICDNLPDNDQIRVGIINYSSNTDNGRLREVGFRNYMHGKSNVKIVSSVTVDNNSESATNGALKLLRDNSDINAIVGFNEWTTLGIGNAVEELGLSNEIFAVGFDANVASVEQLESGEMDALIVQNPFAIGYLGVQKAALLVDGIKIDENKLYTDTSVVMKDNMFDEDIQKILFRFK